MKTITTKEMEEHINDLPLATGAIIENKWQLCPKCNGDGDLWAMSTTVKRTCDLCSGRKIISTFTGLPPL